MTELVAELTAYITLGHFMAVARIYYLSLVWLHKKQTITENAYDRKARIVRVNALFSSINLLFTFIKQQLQL